MGEEGEEVRDFDILVAYGLSYTNHMSESMKQADLTTTVHQPHNHSDFVITLTFQSR